MHCDCCDKGLTDEEATARFLEADGTKSDRFVNMCSTCRSFLPPSVRYVTRSDLKDSKGEELYDPFDLGDMDDESW